MLTNHGPERVLDVARVLHALSERFTHYSRTSGRPVPTMAWNRPPQTPVASYDLRALTRE